VIRALNRFSLSDIFLPQVNMLAHSKLHIVPVTAKPSNQPAPLVTDRFHYWYFYFNDMHANPKTLADHGSALRRYAACSLIGTIDNIDRPCRM